MSIYGELKRRNVLRVAIAYLAMAWLVIQVVETLFPVYGLSDQAIRIAVSVLAVGFFPALILAWVFERTPTGIKRDEDVGAGESTSTQTLDRLIIIMLVVAVGYFGIDKFVFDPARDSAREIEIVDQVRIEERIGSFGDRSIAVLPFVNMSSDPEQQFFSDGISEELLNLLASIPELRVISRSSAFSFRDDKLDIPTIADKLNVAHILEGSVRRSGNRVRITAQLIEAGTDTHIWSKTFDRQLDDIFAIQDEIASIVVAELKLELLGPMPQRDEIDSKSYSQYLQARHIWSNRIATSYAHAEELLDAVIESNPTFVSARILLAAIYFGEISARDREREAGRALIREVVSQASEIDPQNYEVLNYSAWMAQAWDRDLAKSARLYQQSLAINPAAIDTFRLIAIFLTEVGRKEQAIEVAEFLIDRDPMCFSCYERLVVAYFNAGRLQDVPIVLSRMQNLSFHSNAVIWTTGHSYLLADSPEAALKQYASISSLFPGPAMQLHGSAMALYDLGRHAEADKALTDYVEISTTVGMKVAEIHAWRGELDDAFAILGELETGTYNFDSPLLRNLHNDPRWQPLLGRLGRSTEELDAIEFNFSLPSIGSAMN